MDRKPQQLDRELVSMELYQFISSASTKPNPAELLSAMANEKRLEILRLLQHTEVKVSDLAKLVGLSMSAVSQHLFKLRELNVVTTRRFGQEIYYFSHHNGVRMMLKCIDEIERHH